MYDKKSLFERGISSLEKAVRFLLEYLLREKIGGDAEIRSVAIGRELKIEIKGTEIEYRHLKGWLREIFQHFTIRDLPFGFFAHNEDRSELLAIIASANREFVNYDILPSSFVTILAIR